MNKPHIQHHNEEALHDADELLTDLKAKHHTPYINSVIVANGLRDTAKQIMDGFDEGYHTNKLTPYQRVIFSWAYIEVLSGFIEYSLQANTMPEGILVPK